MKATINPGSECRVLIVDQDIYLAFSRNAYPVDYAYQNRTNGQSVTPHRDITNVCIAQLEFTLDLSQTIQAANNGDMFAKVV